MLGCLPGGGGGGVRLRGGGGGAVGGDAVGVRLGVDFLGVSNLLIVSLII